MLKRTHLAIGLAIGLYFLPYVNNQLLFIPIIIISSLLPDLDSANSYLGRKRFLRPLSMILKHRGILHTYTFCILISIILAMYYPIYALPFFLGYSFHLLADSFTTNGIRPFWPLKYVSTGVVNTGGKIDNALFYTFLIINAVLISITLGIFS